MGELVFLSKVLEDRSRPARGPAAFFFALDCPFSYLAAERVERALGEIDWVPVLSSDGGWAAGGSGRVRGPREALLLAEREAHALRLPLVEPHDYPFDPRPISRAAAHAAELGVAAKFALTAMRLAFCGGYDLSDPDVISEAAEVTGLRGGEAVAAAGETRYDARLEATTNGLASRGVRAPAIRIGKHWFQGVDAVIGASTLEGIVQPLPLPPA